jgi:hypothetical protein
VIGGSVVQADQGLSASYESLDAKGVSQPCAIFCISILITILVLVGM